MRNPSQVFDIDLFWQDVADYVERHDLKLWEVSDICDLGRGTFSENYKFKKSVSLLTAYSLGKFCDLDMNRYMK